jgi:aspartate/methionine/tyrosine aminotransferase
MHWAKNQSTARFHLGGSEVVHFRMDRLDLDLADLEMDGASYYRYEPLRRAIAAKHGVSAEQVVAVDGTSMANFLAMAALIKPGDDVLAEHPAYEPMTAAASFLGARLTRFERRRQDGFAIDPDAVERALTPATRLILITNLHNPSGVLAGEAELGRIAALAESVGARVLVDEVYLDSAFAETPRSAVHLGPVFISTSSLTKVYGLSGLRCGWILAEPALAERMWRLNELFGVAQAHQAERLGCIAFARLDEIAAGTLELLDRNHALANAFLAGRDDLDCPPVRTGITIFPRRKGGEVDRLHALLRDTYETSVVPGRWFGAPDHFRVGLGGPSDMVAEGLERIGHALDSMR